MGKGPVSGGSRQASKVEFLADFRCFNNFPAGCQDFFLNSVHIPQSDFFFLPNFPEHSCITARSFTLASWCDWEGRYRGRHVAICDPTV